jgi:hypothetical protein
MLLTPHILAGGAIVAHISNPALGLLIVLLSHYALDFFPQTEYTIKKIRGAEWSKAWSDFLKVLLDLGLGATIVLATSGFNLLTLAAIAFAIFPDFLTLMFCIFPKNKFAKNHFKIHAAINAVLEKKKLHPIWGVLTQVAVSITAICLLK